MGGIVIVYHSGYGHTKRIAEAVASSSGGGLLTIDAEGTLPDGGWDLLAAADMIVFGCPTNMGGPSWPFKRFADASSEAWLKRLWRNKLAAGFTNSATLNGDKFSTITYLFTLSQQHGMFWTGTGMHPSNAKAHTRDDLNNLGGYAGLLTATPSDASPDEMVPGDLKTARVFGERLVEALDAFGRASQ